MHAKEIVVKEYQAMINKYAGIEYEDVVRQYADDITRLCVVWTQNEEAAKDCFQNTFLKLYQTEQTFREEEHIKAWLYTVARNECRDYHRQFWNRNVDIGYVPQENQKAGSLQIEDEETEQLVVALRKLPFRYREVIVLYLKRLSMGQLQLDETLEPGKFRPLTGSEIDLLKSWN